MTIVAFFITSTNAASQASLNFQGEILPDSCDMTIDNGGALQLGKLNTQQFPSEKNSIRLQERNIVINITCPAATLFAIRPIDIAINAGNVKHESVEGNRVFSLGQSASGKAIGGYYASIDKSRSRIDGRQPENILFSDDQGHSWQLAQGYLTANGKNVYSWGEQLQPRSARSVKVSLLISPFLFQNSYSDAVKIDGLTSFELIYL
jgi:type 1 fimbria pilin